MAGFSSRTPHRYATPSSAGSDAASRPSSLTPRRREAPTSASGRIAADDIARSVEAVERAVGNIAALQENRAYYRDLAIELRQAFDDEKEHAKMFAQQLADADRARRADSERADRAERRLEQAATTIDELERQLAGMRAKVERLAHAVNRLAPGDRMAPGERIRDGRAVGGGLADLLAA